MFALVIRAKMGKKKQRYSIQKARRKKRLKEDQSYRLPVEFLCRDTQCEQIGYSQGGFSKFLGAMSCQCVDDLLRSAIVCILRVFGVLRNSDVRKGLLVHRSTRGYMSWFPFLSKIWVISTLLFPKLRGFWNLNLTQIVQCDILTPFVYGQSFWSGSWSQSLSNR